MKSQHSLINLAQTFLSQNNYSDASICLQSALAQNPADIIAHNLTEIHRLPFNFSDAFGVNAVVSDQDDILRFFIEHPTCFHPIRDYLSDGWRNLLELMQLMEKIDRKLSDCDSFLEFACGFGRLTRHLKNILKPDSLYVSDVVSGSVDFLKEQLNVKGFYSSTKPNEAVSNGLKSEQFDIIFVLSLFSHLPQQTWNEWLSVLFSALRPNGILIFSAHGEKSATKDQVKIPDSGFLFFPQSESQALDEQTYGCTYTSFDYVQHAVDQLPDSQKIKKLHHFPAHFWGHQDAYVLIKSA